MKNSTDTRAKIQNSGMGVKFLLYLALIVAMFFLPASGFGKSPSNLVRMRWYFGWTGMRA